MTSEIRTNSLKSRAGLSTVTMTDSGPMFSGITTFVDNSGFTFGVGGGTSIFTPATNVLTFGTNNTEKIRIDASGHMHGVGVITATHFYGDGSNLTGLSGVSVANQADNRLITATGTTDALNGEANLTFDGSNLGINGDLVGSNNTTLYSTNGGSGVRAGLSLSGSDQSIKFYTVNGGSERLRIDSSGRLLVGSTSTNQNISKIVVKASSPSDNYDNHLYLEGSETTGDANTGGVLGFGGHDGGSSLRNWANIWGVKENSTDGNTASYMAFHTRPNGGNPTERLRIDSSGRLLVNRTSTYASSSEKLSVNGMTSIQGSSTSTAPLYVFNTESTADGTVQPFFFLHDGSGIRGGLGLQRSTSNFIINAQNVLQFRIGSSGVGGSERARITSNGNILVGKTADAGKGLEIYQNANAALRIQNSSTGQGAGDGLLIEVAGSDALFWNYENAAIRFGTNNTDRVKFLGGGQVNIGGDFNQTTYPLSVLGSTGGNTNINIVARLKYSGNSNQYNTGTVIAFTNTDTNANAYSYIGARIDSGSSGANANALVFATNATNTAPTEKLRITSSGNLKMPDAAEIQLGNDTQTATGDLRLYHNGSNSAVQNSQGALYISNKETNSSDLHLQGKTSIQMHCPADGNVRLKVDNNGRIKFFPAGESGGVQGAPMYLQVQTDVINANSPTGGSDQTGMFRIEDRGSTNGRYHGIELRNRNSGDIRILNKDVNVSNGAVLVFAVDDNGQFDGSGTIRQYLQINGQGQTSAITLSGAYHVVASARDGLTSANAAASAWEIKKTLGPAARTGYYYLKNPYDGTTSQWWCDMETDGGGWVLIAHTGDGAMSDQGTGGTHWWSRNNKGGFDTVGAGYYAGGGYWRQSNGAWGENTNGQLMWDVRTHYSKTHNKSNDKVVFNWGTDQALPSGNSGYSNIPNATNRRFNEWCYSVENAAGFNPMNYDNNVRSNKISGDNHFTEHMLMTWSFRGTGGNADNSSDGPYWQIGSHANGLHQHYEESLSGDAHGDGSYGVVSNEDTSWGGGGTNNGYDRLARDASSGTCNVWLR